MSCGWRVVRRIDDRMALTVQVHVFLILLIGLVLRQSDFVLGSTEDVFARFIPFVLFVFAFG
jgi:hypothetical protein